MGTKNPRRVAPVETRKGVHDDLAELEAIQAEPDWSRSPMTEAPSGEGPDRPADPDLRQEAGDWTVHQGFQLLRELTDTVMMQLNLNRLTKTILDQAISILGAERGILFLGRQDTAGLVPVLAVNLQGEELLKLENVSRTILQRAKAGEMVLTEDALVDARFHASESVQLNDMRSILCAPLMAGSSQVGALYLDAKRSEAFAPGLVPLIQVFAQAAAVALENARIHEELVRERDALRSSQPDQTIWIRLTGSGKRMRVLRDQASLAALLDHPLLLIGEPGSGRSVVARSIHEASRRAHGPYLTMDCSAIPAPELRGVLYGKRGIGVNASGPEAGLLHRADKGTIHVLGGEELAEAVGDGLLDLLETGTYRALGNRREDRADARFIISLPGMTDGVSDPVRPFRTMLRKGSVLELHVPPLRERTEDIPELVNRILQESDSSIRLDEGAVDVLMQHSWPGNVAELRQVIHRLALQRSQGVIGPDEVRRVIEDRGIRPAHGGPWSGQIRTLREWEDEAIRQALIRTGGNKTEAARLLGIHRNTLGLKVG